MRRRRAIPAGILPAALVVAALVPGGAGALPPINVDERGAAVKGYDVVAYFTAGAAVMGDPAFAREWKGAAWWFSTEEHLSLFRDTPEKYAPQYGGY